MIIDPKAWANLIKAYKRFGQPLSKGMEGNLYPLLPKILNQRNVRQNNGGIIIQTFVYTEAVHKFIHFK